LTVEISICVRSLVFLGYFYVCVPVSASMTDHYTFLVE
jgi:hypothetical protein